jgi:hypothetical protein
MLRPDAVLSGGISLVILGGIILVVSKLAGRGAVAMREHLIEEAKHDRDNPKQERLGQEVRSIRRLPRIGGTLMVLGGVTILVAIAMFVLN